MYHAPPSVLAHFTAAVHQTAIERRKRNSIQGIHAPPLSFDPDTFLAACIALFGRSAKSTHFHFLAEREENRLKIQCYNWTPKLSPLDKWQHDWITSGVFEEGANSSRRALRCLLVPTTIQQLLGAFSSPRQINRNSIPGSLGINIGTAPYCHRLLLRLNPLTPNTTCPVAPMQAPPTKHQPHYHYHAAPPIPWRFPRQAPYPILISPSFLACSEYRTRRYLCH